MNYKPKHLSANLLLLLAMVMLMTGCNNETYPRFSTLFQNFSKGHKYIKFSRKCEIPSEFSSIGPASISCIEFTQPGYFDKVTNQLLEATYNATEFRGWNFKFRGNAKTIVPLGATNVFESNFQIFERIVDKECNQRLYILFDERLMNNKRSYEIGTKVYLGEPHNLICHDERTFRNQTMEELIKFRENNSSGFPSFITMNVGKHPFND